MSAGARDRARVAIVHDYLTQRGGAERVVLSLHRLFPEAPVYTSVYDPAGTFPEFESCDVRTSPLQRLPRGKGAGRALLPLYPWSFGRLELEGFDVVVSSSSGFAHGVRSRGGHHLCYCYTPARWLYRTDHYLAEGAPVPAAARPLLSPVFAALRRWDRRAARRPDTYVAISREIAARIERVYGRTARVVHPPVQLGRLRRPDGEPPAAASRVPDEPYFLVISRLLPYKRVDLVAETCRRRGSQLVVVGQGPAAAPGRAVAGPETEMRGDVDDATLADLLSGCTALVQAGTEDFGLVPLEANDAGRPVVAFAGGGALETVHDGTSGVLFAEPTVGALDAALASVEAAAWDAAALRAHAARFGEERFHEEILAVLREAGVSL